MKTQTAGPETGALFSAEETVSRQELDRVPDHADFFQVPVSDKTVRIIQKTRKGFGSVYMSEALRGLDAKQKICTVSRSWVRQLWKYVGPIRGKKGGMQTDATQMLPDFRAYCLKVEKEEGRA